MDEVATILIEDLTLFAVPGVDIQEGWGADEPEASIKLTAPEILTAPPSNVVADESEPDTEAQSSASGMIPVNGAWVVSTARNTHTLHIVGSCFRTPGIHYHQWIEVDQQVEPHKFKKACKTCFPRGHPLIDAAVVENVESESRAWNAGGAFPGRWLVFL